MVHKAEYTPHRVTFDVGNTTSIALTRFARGTPPLKCGGKAERDNGNGSLMRILPIVFYLRSCYGTDFSRWMRPAKSSTTFPP